MKGSYKKREDGRYSTTIVVGKTEFGKPITQYVYGKTKEELKSNIDDIRYQQKIGMYTNDHNYTIRTWYEVWLRTYIEPNYAGPSLYAYKNIFKNHLNDILDIRLSELSKLNVNAAIAKEAGHWDIQRRIRLYLQQMLREAKENHLVSTNVAKSVHIPKRPKSERRGLTSIERKAIENANFTIKQKAFIYVLLYTGIRRGEALALCVSDINIKKDVIYISHSLDISEGQGKVKLTKTEDGERWLDIYDPLHEVLQEYLPTVTSDVLFPAVKTNTFMSASAFRRFYESIQVELNRVLKGKWHYTNSKRLIWDDNKVDGLTCHIFRHNFCNMLYYSGVDIKESVRIMGHADEKMILEIYAHLDKQKSKSKTKLNTYICENAFEGEN